MKDTRLKFPKRFQIAILCIVSVIPLGLSHADRYIPTPVGGGVAYIVQSGDTLSEIGRSYGLSMSEIYEKARQLGDELGSLSVGDTLLFPEVGVPDTEVSIGPIGTDGFYRVAHGDSIYGIAKRFGVSVAELDQNNEISEPSDFRVSMLLKIPGIEPAEIRCGLRIYSGVGCDTAYQISDPVKAAEVWRFEAERGNPSAQFYLGYLLTLGLGVSKNTDEANAWFKLAAEAGLPEAQHQMHFHYRINNDASEETRLLQLAAEQLYAPAMIDLANNYRLGFSVSENKREAFRLMLLAAEMGNEKAIYEITEYFEQGVGTMQDYKAAFRWASHGAELGFACSQMRLGRFHERGRGVSRPSVVNAHMWYNIASAMLPETPEGMDEFGYCGVNPADERDYLARYEMSAFEVNLAQSRARECIQQDFKNCGR